MRMCESLYSYTSIYIYILLNNLNLANPPVTNTEDPLNF